MDSQNDRWTSNADSKGSTVGINRIEEIDFGNNVTGFVRA